MPAIRILLDWRILVLCLTLLAGTDACANEKGRFIGAEESEPPAWFRQSFLDFDEDVRVIADLCTQLNGKSCDNGGCCCELLAFFRCFSAEEFWQHVNKCVQLTDEVVKRLCCVVPCFENGINNV